MKTAIIIPILVALIVLASTAHARVDAKFIIKDKHGNQIYMVNNENEIIYGNVLAGEEIIFDATASNSAWKIERYHWNFSYPLPVERPFNAPDNYNKIVNTPTITYKFDNPGVYGVYLLAVAPSAPPAGDGDDMAHEIIVVDKFTEPTALLDIELHNVSDNKISYKASAINSYDQDGFIRYYSWDIEGDNIFENFETSGLTFANYSKNGYYNITVKATDYDDLSNQTYRIIKIDNISGELDEINCTVELVNKRKEPIDILIIANNNERYEVTIDENIDISLQINQFKNELYISDLDENVEYILFFKGDTRLQVEILDETIAIKDDAKIPSFEFDLLIVSIVCILLLFSNKRKLKMI